MLDKWPEDSWLGMIVITTFYSVRQAVESMQARADDFMTKPLDLELSLLIITRERTALALKDEVLQF